MKIKNTVIGPMVFTKYTCVLASSRNVIYDIIIADSYKYNNELENSRI